MYIIQFSVCACVCVCVLCECVCMCMCVCVLNLMLPTCRPNFTAVTRSTSKVEPACSKRSSEGIPVFPSSHTVKKKGETPDGNSFPKG